MCMLSKCQPLLYQYDVYDMYSNIHYSSLFIIDRLHDYMDLAIYIYTRR